MRILVTGAGGFIGGYIVNKLRETYASAEFMYVSNALESDSIHVIGYDARAGMLIGSESNISCDILIHAGAFTPKNSGMANDINGSTSNISFTADIFRKLDVQRLKKVIFLSTLDVYESAPVVDESTATIPSTLYGLGKLYCERLVEEFCSAEGVSFLIYRVGHVFGIVSIIIKS